MPSAMFDVDVDERVEDAAERCVQREHTPPASVVELRNSVAPLS
jgi:hypothetical protein